MSLPIEGSVPASQWSAEAPDATAVYRIWPGDGKPAGSEDWTWSERTAQIPWSTAPKRYTRNVVVPTVTVFQPAPGKGNGTAMVVAPGGAFHFLMMDHEGYDMARWLTERGVTAFVLKYRLGKTPEEDSEVLAFRNELQSRLGAPTQTEEKPPSREHLKAIRMLGEEDGRQAIRFIRANAAAFGVDREKIGIGGYSAGGGVSMGATMQYDKASRPDFALGVYPAWRAEHSVPADAPPLFLVISDDDKSVAPISSTRLYEAWHKAGISAEVHVFANGAHGWGMNKDGFLSDPWIDLFGNWLRVKGFLG